MKANKDFDISRYHDEYVEELEELIRAKAKGEIQIVSKIAKEPRSGPDLIADLRASLERKN